MSVSSARRVLWGAYLTSKRELCGVKSTAHRLLPSAHLCLTVHSFSHHRHPSNPSPTDHQLRKADVEFLWVRDGTGELQILQWVAVPEVDLGKVTASKAAKEAQAMGTPLAEGHGHCRLGWLAGRQAP